MTADVLSSAAHWRPSRKTVRYLFWIWLAVFIIEYVYLGPRSYIWMDDEGELLVTHFNFINRLHPGGQYSHLLAGGMDVAGTFLVGSSYLSFDRFLLGVFPLWIGILIHKASVCAFGFIGTYLACRRGLGCSRAASAAAAALFTVFYYRLLIVTFSSGMSWALLPLGVYLCVVRSGRRFFALGALAFAALCAVAFSAYHGLPPVVAGLVAAAVLLRRWHFRVAGAIVAVILAVLLNNAESFHALLAVSPYSVRGSVGIDGDPPFLDAFVAEIANGFWTLRGFPVVAGLMGLSFGVMLWRRDRLLLAAVGAVLVPIAATALYGAFPWHALGLAPVRNAPYGFFLVGWFPVAALIGARAADLLGAARAPAAISSTRSVLPALGILGVAAAILVGYKVHNFRDHLATAGQSVYATVDNIRHRPWAPNEPFRAVVLRDKHQVPEPNVHAAFYGVPMFDGWLNLQRLEHADYWRVGIHKEKVGSIGIITDIQQYVEIGGEARYRIDRQVSLPLLAVANVRFVFSGIPLSGEGLRFVDGPDWPWWQDATLKLALGHRPVGDSRLDRNLARLKWRLGRLFHYGKVFVYEIEGALPRVYAAAGVAIVSDDASPRAFFDKVEQVAPRRIAVIRAHDANDLPPSFDSLAVSRFDLVVDGFDAAVDAPSGGLLVINASPQPFFTARADGLPVRPIPVNGNQVGIPVPPGARSVEVRYRRPTVWQAARDRLRRLLPGRAGAAAARP